jgi:lipopolysaccharide/colanic/teichoic acid biosynthesis glycosyltransferase
MTDRPSDARPLPPAWLAAQRVIALALLVVGSPVLAAIAIGVRLSSRGPVLHRAVRARPGGTFMMLKFRSMTSGSAHDGPAITVAGDVRVTRFGRFLRRYKLDELPQLWHVVRGDMHFVGPRPEDPRYVSHAEPTGSVVHSATPGITGPASLAFRDEESILAAAARSLALAAGRHEITDADIDGAYRSTILPRKSAIDAEYLAGRTVRSDLRIIGGTIGQVLRRQPRA